MNSLKNLMIIAVLTAVGYGVYVSLQRNNVDQGQPPGVADGWPSAPKIEMPSHTATPPSGGPLALGGSVVKSGGPADLGSALAATPASPYPSSAAAAAPPLITSAASSSTSSPSATLGPPIPSDTAVVPPINPVPVNASMTPPTTDSQSASINPVRNIAPPPIDASPMRYAAPAPIAAAPAPSIAPPAPSAAEKMVQNKMAAFMDEVQKTIDAGKLAEAELALSKLYGNPDLPPDQAKRITAMLDQLAGTVIYSRQCHIEPPYVTQAGDTIERIAQRYNVPWQLLARINGLMPPGASNATVAISSQPLPVGRVLKVVRGPFDAVVHLDRRELTLMLGNRYAGRFPIGLGRDQPKLDGEYTVRDKTLNPTYYGPDGINIGPNDPKNPLGGAWIGLTDRIGIHGTSDPQAIGRDDNRGAICTGDRDLQDLYGILSVGSRVTILR